jgi:hypothetical protein
MARGTWGGTLDPHIFKVNFLFLKGTSKCQWGFKLRDVGIQDNTAQEVADQCLSVLGNPFRTILTPRDSLLGVDVLQLGSEEGGWAPASPGVGTQDITEADETPDFTSCAVNLKAEIRKRYGQGRFFLPIVYEGDVGGNIINNNGVIHVNNVLTPLQSNFTGDPVTHDLILVNAHPLLPMRGTIGGAGFRPEIPASWYDVTSVRINTLVTSLRSRKAGVGS